MILSDGTTDIEVEYANEVNIPVIDKSTRTSASGNIKSQTSGKRFALQVKCRTTATIATAMYEMLTNGAAAYYYTPEENHAPFSSSLYPIEVSVSDFKIEWDNRSTYYLNFKVESVSYL